MTFPNKKETAVWAISLSMGHLVGVKVLYAVAAMG